jgi:hypothetical protein
MAKQAKPKSAKGTRNDSRPNGKAWKQSHGTSGPPVGLVEKAAEQSKTSHRRNVKAIKKKKGK